MIYPSLGASLSSNREFDPLDLSFVELCSEYRSPFSSLVLVLIQWYWISDTSMIENASRGERSQDKQDDQLLTTIQLCLAPRTELLQSNMRQLAIVNWRNISLVDCCDIAQQQPSLELSPPSTPSPPSQDELDNNSQAQLCSRAATDTCDYANAHFGIPKGEPLFSPNVDQWWFSTLADE